MAGRKSTYDPNYCELLIEHMKRGLSFETFGSKISKDRKTLYNWVEAHPEFKEAKEIAHLHSQYFWESRGIEGLTERGFNAAVWIFTMKNRFKWVDVEKHIIEDSNYTDEEIINAAKGKSS